MLKIDSEPVVSPARLDFGLISIHDKAKRQITIQNGGRAPLHVTAALVDVSGGANALSAGNVSTPFIATPQKAMPLTLETAQSTQLDVAYVPTGAGQIRGVLRIQNDSTDAPEVAVELAGQAIDAQATISPGQLDFGKIEVGSSAVQGLTVANDTPLDLTVTPTPAGDDSDEFSAHAVTVPAHGQKQLPVTFAPTRLGRVSSAIMVTRCEGCEADQVNLFGEGIDSAIVVDPNPLNFGSVPVDATANLDARITNVSSVPVELYGVHVDPSTDPSYHLELQVPDYILPPGAWLATTLRFTPTHLGDASGSLIVDSASKRHPNLQVPLVGRGGGAEVAVAPGAIDFGEVPVMGEGDQVVTIRNAGTTGDVLTVQSVDVAGTFFAKRDTTTYPVQLAANQSIQVHVLFDPLQPGPAQGTVSVRTSDGSAPQVTVSLQGSGRSVTPCAFSVSPSKIDFGNVPPGTGAVLGLRFTNQGSDVCSVRNVHLGDTSTGFFMPGGDINSLLLYPGDAFATQVAFQPSAHGTFGTVVHMEVSDPQRPSIDLPVEGTSTEACLTAAPPYIDFGALRRDCSHADKKTHVVNQCAAPVTVADAHLGEGTSSEFNIVSGPAQDTVLQPGAGFNVEVSYAAQQPGQNFTPMYIDESDVHRPLLVPLLGEGLHDGNTSDEFVQSDGHKADVLFVVDNSESMVEEQPRLRAAIPSLVQAAQAQGMDLHVAVTTTGIDPVTDPGCGGGANGGEAGRFFPVDHSNNRIVDLTQADAVGTLQSDVNVGFCHHLEQGLEATRRALSSPLVDHDDDPATAAPADGNLGFLRADAQLSVVVVSDEDDHSGDDVNDYATFLRSVHGLSQPQRVGFFAIAPVSACATSSGSSAPRYQQMAQATGGSVWDVCNNDYGPALAQIAASSFGAQTRFPLTQLADPTSVTVTVDGAVPPQGSWSYDPATNAVVFTTAPATGAKIDVHYKQACP